MSEQGKLRLAELEQLTVHLGGKFLVHECPHRQQMAAVLSAKADELEATQLVIGQSRLSFREELRRGSMVKQLLRLSGHRDVWLVNEGRM